MLDKSVPYKVVIMKMPGERLARIQPQVLPKGFKYRFYVSGDEEQWCDLETSVLEFSEISKAREYFERDFLPLERELFSRMVFIVNDDGLVVATATAWWSEYEGRHQAAVHWVAVRPEYQGLGLGKALVSMALSLLAEIERGNDVYLQTQTWSHRAIRMYVHFGFCICRNDSLGKILSEYEDAMNVLASVYDEEVFREMELQSC